MDFRYTVFQPLEFSETSHMSNLTSILDIIIYIILGLDYDSFSLNSGTEFSLKQKKIVNNAQYATRKGMEGRRSTSRRKPLQAY
jgi:lipoate-protein ligase A